MRISDKEIHNISELLGNLSNDSKGLPSPLWYRGHCNKNWTLVPSIFRKKSGIEINYIRQFKQDATLLVDRRPANSWEWLFIMRHYNVPTRLLDWTESPLVATYFAVTGCPDDEDGALWVLLPLELNKQKGRILDDLNNLPSIDEDEVMEMYKPDNYEKEKGRVGTLPIAFLAPRNTQRMQSQLSVFTINHTDPTPVEEIGDRTHVWRYIIPKDAKKIIKTELELLKIGKFQLYPELDSIGHKLNMEQ